MASAITRYNTQRMTGDVLAPGKVIADNISTAGVFVGKGKLCRIRVTAATFIAFGPAAIGAVSATTDPGLELGVAGTYLVIATEDYIRGSASVARLEIIS